MRLRTLLRSGLGAGLLGLAALPALAEDVTPMQATVLEAQIKAWIGSLGGTMLLAGPGPVQVRPSGDHFDLTVPLRMAGPVRGDLQVTGTAKPGPAGSWSVADMRTAMPLRFVVDLPRPPKDGEKGPARTVPVTYTVDAAAQDGGGSYDPSFTRPWTMTSTVKGMTIQAEGEGVRQTSTLAEFTSGSTLTPRDGGRVDVATTGAMSGYRVDSLPGPDTPAISATVDRIELAAAINGVSRARVTELVQIAADAGEMVRKAGPGPKPKLPPAMMTQMIAALQDLSSDMNLVEGFQGVKMTVGGMEFAMDQVRLAMAGKSDQGLLRVAMELGYGGLRIPDFGLGELQDLVPRTLAFRPYVTGVAAADLARIATTLNDGRDPSPAEIAAVFSHGGVVYGFEDLSLDVAGTRFASQGKVTMASMQSYAGTGRITADNFDALMQKLGAIPAAQQAMPAVIFLKGIGKADAGKLVWDIAYDGGKLLVNGMDLSAMVGAGQAAGPRGNQGNQGGGAPKGPPPNRVR